jgi:hypothetical protein
MADAVVAPVCLDMLRSRKSSLPSPPLATFHVIQDDPIHVSGPVVFLVTQSSSIWSTAPQKPVTDFPALPVVLVLPSSIVAAMPPEGIGVSSTMTKGSIVRT